MRSSNPSIVLTLRIFLCLLFVLFSMNTCYSRDEFGLSPDYPGGEVDGIVFREGITSAALDSLDRQDTLSRWRVGMGIYGSRLSTSLNDYASGFSIRYKTKVTWKLDVWVPFSAFVKFTSSKKDTTAFIAIPSVTAYWKPFEFKLSLITMSVDAPGTKDDWFFIFPMPSLRFLLGDDDFYMTIDIFRVDLESMTNIDQAIIGIGANSADFGTRFWIGVGYTVPFLFKERILAIYSKFRYSVSTDLGLSLNVNLYQKAGIYLYDGNKGGILFRAGVFLYL